METKLPYADLDSPHVAPSTIGGGTPGKRSMTQGMAPRTVIYRAAERDGNGVAVDAEAAVSRASGGSGAALPTRIQRQFEQSLGTDLSAVRVHTGAESAAAASAVGAKAYTVGNDIHFADGRYQPDDPFGLHLLAHEVAHTAQQSGGAQRRQHKLEVSAPQDAAEHEADRAADAMVRGEAASVSGAAAGAIARSPRTDWTKPREREAWETGPELPQPIYQSIAGMVSPVDGFVTMPWAEAPDVNPSADWSGISASDRGRCFSELDRVFAESQAIWNNLVPMVTTFESASKDPALSGLTGSGQLLDEADNPEAEARPMGVLQKDTFQYMDTMDQAVEYGVPMTMGDSTVGIGDALTSDLASKGVAGRGANKETQEKMQSYLKAQVTLQEAVQELDDACDETSAKSQIDSAQAVLQQTLNALRASKDEEKIASLEKDKGIVEMVFGAIKGGFTTAGASIGKKGSLTGGIEAGADMVGGFISGVYDAKINGYKMQIAQLGTANAELETDNARRALAQAIAALEGQRDRVVVLKNKAVLAENDRRMKLNDLGTAAADNASKTKDRNGATADRNQADAIRVKIAALPAVELVIGSAEQIANAANQPSTEGPAGMAASVTRNIGSLVSHLSMIAGAKQKYERTVGEWKARKAEIERFIHEDIM